MFSTSLNTAPREQGLDKNMTAIEIIEAIKSDVTGIDAQGILSALEDGAALASLGIADADQDAVEEAHDIIKQQING